MVIPVLTQHHAMLKRNLLYAEEVRGKRLVARMGQKKANAIAVRNTSERRRWSMPEEWLAGAKDVTETNSAGDTRSLRERPVTGVMPHR